MVAAGGRGSLGITLGGCAPRNFPYDRYVHLRTARCGNQVDIGTNEAGTGNIVVMTLKLIAVKVIQNIQIKLMSVKVIILADVVLFLNQVLRKKIEFSWGTVSLGVLVAMTDLCKTA